MIIPSLKLTTTRSSFVSVSKYYSRMSNQFTILSDDKTIENHYSMIVHIDLLN